MLFSSFATLLIASSALAAPVPKWKREVPQEHSHEAIIRAVRPVLNLNNPDAIVDVIFGLLGNAAASTGKGNIADPDCLQTATADQAFTNAKAAGDVAGMTAALQYRALERNTGAVGQASVLCTSFTPVNPEIAALTQHQDPASNNAAAINKGIVLELAKQIAAIGGNPLDALATGTFAPGQIGDPTGAGNTCDDENDAIGCIVSLNRLVLDATEEEILAAVGGNNNATPPAADDTAAADCPSVVTVTVTADTAAATSTEAAAPATTTAASTGNNNTGNLQSFKGALGGIEAPKVTPGGRNFVVENNADFLNIGAALGRSCDVQHNQCANAANSGANFSVGDCDRQNDECRQAINGANVAAITTRQEATTTAVNQQQQQQQGGNLQAFSGALGGIQAPAVTPGGRNFVVANNSDFLNIGAALGRSCDVQHNQCANAANSGADFTVGDCDRQNEDCRRNI